MTGTFICECGFVTRSIPKFNRHSCKKFKPNSPPDTINGAPADTPEETKGEMATSEGLLGGNLKSSGTQTTNKLLKTTNLVDKAQKGWDKEADKIRNQGFDLSKKAKYISGEKITEEVWHKGYLKEDVREFIRVIQEDMKGLNGEEALRLIIKRRAGADLK